MTITKLTPSSETAAKLPRVADTVIISWCGTHRRTSADISDLADTKEGRLLLCSLAYCLRRYAKLELGEAADALRLHPGTFVAVMQSAIHRIRIMRDEKIRRDTALLLRAMRSFLSPKKGADRGVGAPKESPQMRRILREHRERRRLEERGEEYIAKVLAAFPSVSRAELFRHLRRTDASQARFVCYAVMYHLVQTRKNQRLIASYCNVNINTVQRALAIVHRELSKRRDTAFKQKIECACRELGVPTSRLLLLNPRVKYR